MFAPSKKAFLSSITLEDLYVCSRPAYIFYLCGQMSSYEDPSFAQGQMAAAEMNSRSSKLADGGGSPNVQWLGNHVAEITSSPQGTEQNQRWFVAD